MADIDSLAAALFGTKRAETQEVLTDATTRTYTGTAVTDSEDGTVIVDLGGDVTLPDDIEGLAEYSADGVEVATGPGVRAGDEVIVTLVGGTPLKTPMVTGVAGEGDRQDERIHAIEADYVKASTLEADVADVGFLKADSATIKDMQADTAKVHDLTADQLSAATAYIASLNAKSVTAETLAADVAKVHDLTADQLSAAAAYIAQLSADSVTAQRIAAISGDFDAVRANAAKVANLTAAELEADHATIGTLDTTYATIANLNAANGRIANLESTKANISDLEADYITADEIEATYMHANMSNSDVAWIENGTIKNGAIVSAMINDVSANKLTAGTINGSVINVTNLNADNITTGTINGQRIGEGSLSLDKLSEDVYTETEVNNIVDGLNDRIDGAIETHTGTTVPTLNNSPASSWNTTKLRDEHVGDVYYVVNSQSQQNGYCYRFTKSGSTYSWQLIKDSDVTAALSRLTTAEGKITTFDSDISQLKTDTGTLTTKTTSLETRMSDAESDILDKIDTTTFNSLEDTVDGHTQTLSQHTTAISNKADSSTVTAVTNRVSKNEQDISGINTTIGELQDTVETKADGSTVSTISNKLNTVSDTVDGHTQTLTSVQNTLSSKADSSTVSTLTTKVNNVSDTVDGHTQTLSNVQETLESKADGSTVSTLQEDYATYKQTTTENVSSIGTRLSTAEGKITTAETNITQNAHDIELKVSESDVTGNYLVSKINLDSTTATIDADRVEINGTAVFNNSAFQEQLTSSYSKTIEYTYNNSGQGTGYAKLANITAKTAYLNLPITFTLYRRGQPAASHVTVTFANGNPTDTLSQAYYDGWLSLYYVRVGTGSYDIYIALVESWDTVKVADFVNPYSSRYMEVTWAGAYYGTSLPSGAVAFTRLIGAETKKSYDNKIASAEANAKAYADITKIGGRNLIPWSALSGTYVSAYDKASNGYAIVIPTSTSLVTKASGDIFDRISSGLLSIGSQATISFTAVATGSTNLHCDFYPDTYKGAFGDLVSPVTTTPKRYTITGKIENDSSPTSLQVRFLRLASDANYAITIWDIKLESGTHATDWSPAPEDIVSRTQRIWYRKSASGAPATPGTASSNWVTKADDGNDAWTKMHIAISSTHKYIYTCEQYEMANGMVGYTSVLLDNTITVIDGGNIITGSVTANKLNAASINASKSLTVGAMTDAAASTILNSNIQVGGRNLLRDTDILRTDGSYWYFAGGNTIAVTTNNSDPDGGNNATLVTVSGAADHYIAYHAQPITELGWYTFSIWMKASAAHNLRLTLENKGEYRKTCALTTSWQRFDMSFDITTLSTTNYLIIGGYSSWTGATPNIYFYHPKLEKGNKATDWTPAPEDQTEYVDKSINDIDVGGRNLLRRSYYQQTTTVNGITCTNNGDGSVTINGTTTATPTIYYFNDSSASSRGHVTLEAGTYTLSGCPDGGGDDTWRLDMYDIPTSSGTAVAVDYGDGATFTTTGGTPTFIRLRFPSGITLNNFTVWPKLERGNKATDWTPAPEDMESSIIEASKTASNYITADSTGIKIHMSGSTSTYQHQSSTATTYYVNGNKRAEVGAGGLKVYVGNTGSEVSVAEFGTTARLGAESGYHTEVTSTGMHVSDGTDDVVRIHSEVTQDGIRYGSIDIGKSGDGTLTSVGGSADDYAEGDDYVLHRRTANLTAMASTESDGAWVEAWAERASTWDEDSTGITLHGEQLNLWGQNGEGYGSVSMENAGKVISTQSGMVSQSISAAANAVTTYTVTFPNPYDVAPIVVACFYSTSTAAAFGGLSLSVSAITTTSFTVKIFNNTGTGRSPGLFWIATPQTSQT